MSKTKGEWNLLKVGGRRIMEDIIGASKTAVCGENGDKENQWFVFVVDAHTLKVMSQCLRMYDIVEENITVVENIAKGRQPIPGLPAIYFLTPVEENIASLVKDFDGRRTYKEAHVFFCDTVEDKLVKDLAVSPAKRYIKTLRELHFDYLVSEPRCFHFGMLDGFHNLYSPETKCLVEEEELIAGRLATLCCSLDMFPLIRYEQTSGSGAGNKDVPKTIAQYLQARLEMLLKRGGFNPDLQNRPVFLVAGRTIDPVAPVVSEFTYQAMTYHLQDIQNDRCKYQSGKGEKEAVLNDSDPLWPKLRHMHIADVFVWLASDFNSFLAQNKTAEFAKKGKGVTSVKEMRAAMNGMSEYAMLIAKYSLHISIAEKNNAEFKRRNLMNIGALEQDLATGLDAQGMPPKNIMSTLPPILSDPRVAVEDKKRLIILYIISQEGMKESDRKRMMDYASLSPEDQAAISNIHYLGITLNKAFTGDKKKQKKKPPKQARPVNEDEDIPFELSRFVPRVKAVMRDLISGTLSTEAFPYLKEADGIGTAAGAGTSSSGDAPKKTGLKSTAVKPKWADKGKGKAGGAAGAGIGISGGGGGAASGAKHSGSADDVSPDDIGPAAMNQPFYFLFIAGGMTYSEMRTIYEVSKKFSRNCYIGSTHNLTPQSFVKSLGELKSI